MPSVGASAQRPLRVAIVGAGPSGFYAAAALLKTDGLAVAVDLFDRLPAPFGLVRYGVAPDHQKIKLVSRVFDQAARDPRVRFFGNVTLGEDVSAGELLHHYDQVVYAVGGQSDRRLGIPGEDLPGSVSSTAFVYWYSGHPDWMDLPVDFDHRTVAVVGIGNVAMDVARILAKSPAELAATDIADSALERLRDSRVTDIHVLARRGPVQAKCTPPELKELGEIAGVQVVVDPAELELDAASEAALAEDRQAVKNLEILRTFATTADPDAPRRLHLRFLLSPVAILEQDGRAGALVLERNRLEPAGPGEPRAVGTGVRETLPATLVIRAVGYRSLELPGVPFDERQGLIPNCEGRVLDGRAGAPRPREYVVGWAKRGPSGLIGSNKPDAAETVARMVQDLPALDPAPRPSAEALAGLLTARGVQVVDYPAWQRLDQLEVTRGSVAGRPRVKLCRREEFLAALTQDAAVVTP